MNGQGLTNPKARLVAASMQLQSCIAVVFMVLLARLLSAADATEGVVQDMYTKTFVVFSAIHQDKAVALRGRASAYSWAMLLFIAVALTPQTLKPLKLKTLKPKNPKTLES